MITHKGKCTFPDCEKTTHKGTAYCKSHQWKIHLCDPWKPGESGNKGGGARIHRDLAELKATVVQFSRALTRIQAQMQAQVDALKEDVTELMKLVMRKPAEAPAEKSVAEAKQAHSKKEPRSIKELIAALEAKGCQVEIEPERPPDFDPTMNSPRIISEVLTLLRSRKRRGR